MKRKIIGPGLALFLVVSTVMVVDAVGNEKTESIRYVSISINSKEFRWQKVPGIRMKEGDILIMRAEGKVKVYTDISGEYFAGPTGGAGKLKNSALQVRIGEYKGTFPGMNMVMLSGKRTGDIEFRFNDKKYYDNKGVFAVTILYIPASLVPALKKVKPVLPEKKSSKKN